MASQISKVIASTWIAGEGGIKGINITSANIMICKVDSDPSVSGLALPTGTIAIMDDGSASYLKTGGGTFDWERMQLLQTPKQLTVTTDYSINADTDKIVYVDTTSNDVTITLPNATDVIYGDGVFIIKRVAGTNDVAIVCQGTDTLDGADQITFQEIGVGNISLTISTNTTDSFYII